MAKKWYEFFVEVEDNISTTEKLDIQLRSDLKELGRGNQGEINDLHKQLRKELEPDMVSPPVGGFRILGIDPFRVWEESTGAGSRIWRFFNPVD